MMKVLERKGALGFTDENGELILALSDRKMLLSDEGSVSRIFIQGDDMNGFLAGCSRYECNIAYFGYGIFLMKYNVGDTRRYAVIVFYDYSDIEGCFDEGEWYRTVFGCTSTGVWVELPSAFASCISKLVASKE